MEKEKLYHQIYEKLQESRRKKFLKLMSKLDAGQYDSWQPVLDRMYQLYSTERDRYLNEMAYLHGPRPHYISPLDRGTYNYGYADIGQLMGEPR